MVFKELLVGNSMSLRKKLTASRANKGAPLNWVIRKFCFRDWNEDRFSLIVHSYSLGDVSSYPVGNWSFTESALYVAIVHAFRCPVNLYPIDLDVEFVFHVFPCLLYGNIIHYAGETCTRLNYYFAHTKSRSFTHTGFFSTIELPQ